MFQVFRNHETLEMCFNKGIPIMNKQTGLSPAQRNRPESLVI